MLLALHFLHLVVLPAFRIITFLMACASKYARRVILLLEYFVHPVIVIAVNAIPADV